MSDRTLSDRQLSLLLAFAGILTAWAFHGCTSADSIECGPGTTQLGNLCISDDDPMPPMAMGDAGTEAPPPTGGGGGEGGGEGSGGGGSEPPEYSTTPPGGGSGDLPPGCDEAAGECDAWATAILDGLNERRPGSCGTMLTADPRIVEVAQRHADYQASIDRLDGSSPDGNLFTQVRDAGVRFMYVAAAFSVTRDGPDDVLDRWASDPEIAPLMIRCDDIGGVGVATSETGASYVTLLMVTSLE